MDLRRAGLIILIAALLVLIGLLVVEPLPVSMYDLSQGNARRGITYGPSFTYHDAANDTTFALFGDCGPQPCGDVFLLSGDLRDRSRDGPYLAEPEGRGPIVRTATEPGLRARVHQEGPYDTGAFTISPPITMRPAMPVTWAYMIAMSGVAAGASLSRGLRWTTLATTAAPFASMALAPEVGGVGLILLVFVGVVIATFVAVALKPRRPLLARALGYTIAAFIMALGVASQFTPESGGAM